MHITDALRVLENAKSEWFHNAILNVFDVVLEDALMTFPHALPQREPNIFIKVDTSVAPQVHIP